MAQSYKTIHAFKTVTIDSTTSQIHRFTASNTLNSSHSGDFIVLGSTTASTITLPAPETGYKFHIAIGATAGHLISAPTACIIGGLASAITNTAGSLATGAAKTSVRFTTGSALGDSVQLIGDGTNYFLSGVVGNSASVAYVS
jgi:hypothetical protein